MDETPKKDAKIFHDAPDLEKPVPKRLHTPALVIGIFSIIFLFSAPIYSIILAVIGIVMSIVSRKSTNTMPALVCSILGLVGFLVTGFLGT